MPFGEYVPLPQWLPGASLISGIVGEFTPGDSYTLMPVGDRRAGVFICIEAAYPWIARRLSSDGAHDADQYLERWVSWPERCDATTSGERDLPGG